MDIQKVARIIANCALFVDYGDGETINPDAAAQARARLAADIRAFDKPFLRDLIDAFVTIAPEFSEGASKMVRSLAQDFYLEEAVAVDDPLSLLQLRAERLRRGGE